MAGNFTIARVTKFHAPEIAVVFRTSFKEGLPYLPVLHTADEDLEYFRNRVFTANSVFAAFDEQSKVVGFIAFGNGWVNHLYILTGYQRLGIGGKLLEQAKSEQQSLRLWTFDRNARAQRFYKKHGFFVVKHTDGAKNEERHPDVLFQWNRAP